MDTVKTRLALISSPRTLEYAQNDFGLYQVAKGLGNVADASLYLNRSQ